MNDNNFIESREALSYAREALKNGAMEEARQWAERAARFAPQSEDPWLVLAAASSPRESMEYIRKALEANPESPRAKKGMEWAMRRLNETPKDEVNSKKAEQAKAAAKNDGKKSPKKRSLLPILLILVGGAVLLFAAWSAVRSPVLASILNLAAPKVEQPITHLQSFAQVDIAKPAVSQPTAVAVVPTSTSQPLTATATPTTAQIAQAVIVPADTQAAVAPSNTQAIQATAVPQNTQAVAPTGTPSIEPAATQPEATSIPGVVLAEIVEDTPTSEYAPPPTAVADIPPSTTGSGHWIDVDLSQQRVYAYDGDTVVNSFIVSTGTWQTPTVTGQYHIWIKLVSTPMSGPGYYLPGVPYTMYFYKGYALHGTYWHNNFGTPMSHGCVNLSIPDAEWLYNFSSVGTLVNVHY
ncbi:MAG: L,D-transpeptidase family protein [Chloroflexi bacterium]|nr:L,D-transpeptidase family protein [Chloroflexota bacterium]